MLQKGSTIIFIEPKSPSKHVFSAIKIPRLGPVILATIAKDMGYEAIVYCEDIDPIDWDVVKRASLICISTITSTAPRAYQLIRTIKTMTDALIIIGGPHVTFLPAEALQHGADVVVRGEGEETFRDLLLVLERGDRSMLILVSGITFPFGEGMFQSVDRPFLAPEKLGALPFPDLSLVKGWERKEEWMVYPLSLSRGCPFGCEFCSVIKMFGRRFRGPGIDHCVAQWAHAVQQAHSTIFVVDDNFAGDEKRLEQMLQGVIADGIRTKYSAQLRAQVAKNLPLIRLLRQSGCTRGYFGFESISNETLRSAKKKQTVQDIERCVKVVLDNGMDVHGMFVFFGHETIDDIYRTVEFAKSTGITTAQFLILTPFPGTPVYETKLQDGTLLNVGWQHFTTHEPTFRPQRMSPRQLFLHSVWAHFRFYNASYFRKHLKNRGEKICQFYTAMGIYAHSVLWPMFIKGWVRDFGD